MLSKTVAERLSPANFVTETATILRQEVLRHGAISFAHFMQLALYCPNSGYYEQAGRRIGRAGDFFTSVSTGSLFGELLAFQFDRWLGALDGVSHQLVEAGAHDGRLACDVLTWTARERPSSFETLEYWLVEPSRQRQAWQRETLAKFAGRVHWVESLAQLPAISGVLFANELLDAFPVHRFAWDARAGSWFEWGVGLVDDEFLWQRMPGETGEAEAQLKQAGFDLPAELRAVLPDGFVIEVSPQAAEWWHTAATKLASGRLMTLDYGLTTEEFFTPERQHGTLRAYHQHRVSDNLLAHPGEQDLTAHVNFSQIQRTGESAGLKTEAFTSQARFLTGIAEAMWRGTSEANGPSPQVIRQFQTLTHPEHLGRSFRALVQVR